MFKFNFGNEVNNPEEGEGRKDDVINWYECKRVDVDLGSMEKLKNLNEEEIINLNYEGNITLTCLSPSHIINYLKEKTGNVKSDVLEAEKNHSDLIPGKYEGGLKVWECTKDLVNYISLNLTDNVSGKKVLDLGCGAGILGIVSLLKGASVTFQDYNCEVIELITMPNVFLNLKNSDDFKTKTDFFSGDWGSFIQCLSQNGMSISEEPSMKKAKASSCITKFDYIFSSETIYNSENYDKIYRIIKELMKDDGACYIAAKKCYFGVGGNIHCFTEYLQKEKIFNIETCWSSNQGVAREILKITFHRSK